MKLSDTLLQQEGLSMAHDGATYCGTRGEYTFLILMGRNELVVSVLRGGEEPDKESFRDFVKARPELSGCKTAGTRVIFSLRPGAAAKSYAGKIHTLLPELLSFLHENGYENCCEISHAVGETVGCMTSGVPQLVAPALFTELSRKADQNERIQAETPENIGRGILGALIGGLIGAAAIVLIGQLGYVAAISGMVLGYCTIGGYRRGAGKLSALGIAVSVVVMLAAVYLGNRMGIAGAGSLPWSGVRVDARAGGRRRLSEQSHHALSLLGHRRGTGGVQRAQDRQGKGARLPHRRIKLDQSPAAKAISAAESSPPAAPVGLSVSKKFF